MYLNTISHSVPHARCAVLIITIIFCYICLLKRLAYQINMFAKKVDMMDIYLRPIPHENKTDFAKDNIRNCQ